MRILLADVGGTNSRCAVGSADGEIGEIATFQNAGHASLAELLGAYLASLPAADRPRAAALAVAAPIRGDAVQMVNIGWRFSRTGLQRELDLSSLHVLNDFAALAWALPALTPDDLVQIGGGNPLEGGTKVVLGPGTGLGVAGLVAVDGGWQAVPGEGGHVSMPADDGRDEALIRAAREAFGHCSAERLLSGPGLSFMHSALHGVPAPGAEALGERIAAGDPQATATLETFFRLLGTVAGDVALTFGALGGVYIGGGIARRYVEPLRRSRFRERFESKGRYRAYMSAIPTWIITASFPALTGLLLFASTRRY